MTTAEVLEDRNYVAENGMLQRSGLLASELHEIELELTELRERVHQLVCRSGQVPIEQKGAEIVDRLRDFTDGLDLTGLASMVAEISVLKIEIGEREREISALHRARCDAKDAFQPVGSMV